MKTSIYTILTLSILLMSCQDSDSGKEGCSKYDLVEFPVAKLVPFKNMDLNKFEKTIILLKKNKSLIQDKLYKTGNLSNNSLKSNLNELGIHSFHIEKRNNNMVAVRFLQPPYNECNECFIYFTDFKFERNPKRKIYSIGNKRFFLVCERKL